jgi:hypothetical protein
MFRRFSRFAESVASCLSPAIKWNATRDHIIATKGHAQCVRRRQYFTPLRVEWLERRELLTAIDLATINVTADAHRYTEGQTAWFTFTLAKPALQAFQLDLLLSGGPQGPTGYVLPIAQGETSIHVDFPTSDNFMPGDSYTLNLAITGSSQTGPSSAGPFDSAATRVLDNDGGVESPLGPLGPGGFLESFSGPSGPTGPSSPARSRRQATIHSIIGSSTTTAASSTII